MNLSTIPKLCITLPEKPERTAAAVKHFAESGAGDVTMVDGIYGNTFGTITTFPYTADDKSGNFSIGPHCVGIWLTQWMLWFACSMRPESHFFIFEDDAQFAPDWKARTEQALLDVPQDFDWLFIGSCGGWNHYNKRKIKGQVWDVRYPSCFQAYIIAKKAIPHILATQRKIYAPIDLSLPLHSFPKLKVYTLLPMAVRQFNTKIPE